MIDPDAVRRWMVSVLLPPCAPSEAVGRPGLEDRPVPVEYLEANSNLAHRPLVFGDGRRPLGVVPLDERPPGSVQMAAHGKEERCTLADVDGVDINREPSG